MSKSLNSIQWKLMLNSLLFILIPALIISLISYTYSKKTMNELGETIVKNSVNSTLLLIDSYNDKVQSGEMTLEEAQEKVREVTIGQKDSDGKREITSNYDLGESGYIFYLDEKGMMVGHPNIENEASWDLKDGDGQYYIRNIIANANKGGFTSYPFHLPDDLDKLADKITYSKVDSNWGWIVAASSYKKDFNAPVNHLLLILTLSVLALLVIGTILTNLLSRKFAVPLRLITGKLQQLAAGDLTVPLVDMKQTDEVGQLNKHFNVMVTTIKKLIQNVDSSISKIQHTATNLSATSEEASAFTQGISKTINVMAVGSEKQMQDSQQTKNATDQLTKEFEKLHSRNDFMLKSSNTMYEANENGLQQIDILRKKSDESAQLVYHVQTVFNILTEKMKEIENITTSIKMISDQTNLLALNASIEAARAGEHGKGFAVVADEVRKLAEQTASSTKNVQFTLKGIETETLRANKEIERTSIIVQQQNDAVATTGSSFAEIRQSVDIIRQAIEEVSSGVEDLLIQKNSIVDAVDNIAVISSNTSQSTNEIFIAIDEQQQGIDVITNSAMNLTDQISLLKNSIEYFKIN